MNAKPSRMIVAREAWGVVPDWIEALVRACEEPGSSQNKIAARAGYSGSVISQVIRKSYAGNMAKVEATLRDVVLPTVVNCPALGPIRSEDCLRHRRAAKGPHSAVPLKVMMAQACRNCPRYRTDEEDDG